MKKVIAVICSLSIMFTTVATVNTQVVIPAPKELMVGA